MAEVLSYYEISDGQVLSGDPKGSVLGPQSVIFIVH